MDAQFLLTYLEEYRSREPPPDRRPVGCLLVLAAVAGFVLLPVLERVLGLPDSAGTLGLILFGAMIAIGLVLRIFGSNRYGVVMEEIDEAVATLTLAEAGPVGFEDEEFQKAAVRLLVSAYFSDGPTTTSTFDTGEMARQLGPALHGVEQAERILVDAGEIYPVFSR
jgi:hypothetical protein